MCTATHSKCGQLFQYFKFELQDNAYYPQSAPKLSANCLIGMYHSNTLKKHKERVNEQFFKPDGICRIVFASTALGMGVNIPNVRKIVHFGPPRQVDDFVQEIGRGGRDGKETESLLLYKPV